jgi:PHS family inorganic phosphate transporter-like MFS transporter
LAIFLIDYVGRRRLQIIGFALLAAVYLVLGLGFNTLKEHSVLFLIIYGLSYLFSNMGPNTTTFVIPGEVFPTSARATCHGISAASGKLGAVAGK